MFKPDAEALAALRKHMPQVVRDMEIKQRRALEEKSSKVLSAKRATVIRGATKRGAPKNATGARNQHAHGAVAK